MEALKKSKSYMVICENCKKMYHCIGSFEKKCINCGSVDTVIHFCNYKHYCKVRDALRLLDKELKN